MNIMRRPWLILIFVFALVVPASRAQGPSGIRAHNAEMARLQPALITPVVTADPRLVQYARFSVSHSYTNSGTETVNYGNCRGGGVIVARRFEFDWMPPTYIQHNSKSADGAGDTAALIKYRIASTPSAPRGSFELSAMTTRNFATGSHTNGAATGNYIPALAGAYAVRHLDVISAVGGTLPTGKVATQGRSIVWNTAVQLHATRSWWMEIENNATYYHGGTHDSKMQNFITPAAFYVVRPKEWSALHPFFIVDAGMQVATSGFHTYNHNLITEVRMLF